jgi:hypothetical protein
MLRCESGRSAHTSIPRGNRLRDERGGLGYVRGGPATRFTSGPLPGRVPVVDTQQPVVVTDGLHTPVTPSPANRQLVLDQAHAARPDRFLRPPTAPALPAEAWINRPVEDTGPSAALSGTQTPDQVGRVPTMTGS